ncbi:MAG: glutamate-1-semialdehyde 2,1-aminomutase [Saprospiraceae bacterium]|nr:glutamate-1-semialdehyde 2,1-aminomutase [Saprospiraceae bacterium]
MNATESKKIITNLTQSLTYQSRLHDLIPGGCHTYAKGDDQFPEFYPPVISHGKGCHVWDVDGNQYIEYGMGLRAVSLGHAFEPVVQAAYKQMQAGSNFSRVAKIEMEAADSFLALVPSADMVKFAKNGSDATTAALKLARAYTGRDLVAICADHPFFSVDDWFIGNTAINRGITADTQAKTLTFQYNDLASIAKLFDQYPGQIACLIMEPEKDKSPEDDFLHKAKALCHQRGALFVLDEMITGFRWDIGGAQTRYNIVPDLSTFGKAMGNGFAVSALAGKREIMALGGIQHQEERVFLLSTTHGAENHSLAAALAVIETYKKEDVINYLAYQGNRLKVGLEHSISEHQLDGYVGIHGHPACLIFSTCDQEKKRSQIFRTLFMQECIRRGIIAPNIVISFSHTDEIVDQTIEIMHDCMGVYKKALLEGAEKYLEGRPVQPVYRKYNHQK